MSSKSVSVVVLNYNGHRHLGKILENCLESLFNTNYHDFEVLFVDNASTDDSISFVKEHFGNDPRVRIIQNKKNFGFAEGNNRGIKNSTREYIALLNNDVIVDPNWLAELVKSAEPPEVGAAQSKLLQMAQRTLLDCAGGLLDYYGYHVERGRGEDADLFNQPGEIFYAKGASLLLKREILEKAGLFDPEIFLYFDEVDLCWRIWLSGYRIVYAPRSIVYHASGSTVSATQMRSKIYYYTRNHFLILLKNYNLANAVKAILVSLLLESRNIVLFLARHKSIVALSLMRGIGWNLLHFKRTWKQRQFVQSCIRSVPDREIRKHMLKPMPPFPLYILWSRSKYLSRERSDVQL